MLEVELKKEGKIKRLTNKTFNFDPRLKEGFFTANYFLKTKKIVEENIPSIIDSRKPKCSYLPVIFKTGSPFSIISPSFKASITNSSG